MSIVKNNKNRFIQFLKFLKDKILRLIALILLGKIFSSNAKIISIITI